MSVAIEEESIDSTMRVLRAIRSVFDRGAWHRPSQSN